MVKKRICDNLFSLSQLNFYIFAADIFTKPYNMTPIFYCMGVNVAPQKWFLKEIPLPVKQGSSTVCTYQNHLKIPMPGPFPKTN